MSTTRPESGLRNHRIEYVEETTNDRGIPQPPSDPSWNRASDRYYSFDWSPSANLEGDRGLGDVDVDEWDKAPEEHEITVSYAMQQWFVDDSGDADSMAGYGLIRDSDNLLPATHTVVDREDKGTVQAQSTINGSNGLATRIYTVCIGGKIDSITVTVDPSDQQPINVEVTYTFEYVRRHQIDQPSASETLDVVSTDDDDDSQSVVIESEGAGTTETVSLSGTTAVTSTESFDDIDAIYITDGSGNPADTAGDVTISNSTDGDLAEIKGSSSYANVEGDFGVPALGSGSHSSAIGSSFFRTLVDEITLGGSSTAWLEINSKELSVENNVNPRNRDDTFRMALEEGPRDTSMNVTVYGETESYSSLERSLTATGSDIVWTYPSVDDGTTSTPDGTVTLSTAVLTEPGSVAHEAEETQMTLDNTFEPSGGGSSGLSVS